MNSPLDLSEHEMLRLGSRVAEVVSRHLSTLRQQPVFTTLTRVEAERLVSGPAPESGRDFEGLLDILNERVFAHTAREPHPGFLAYVPSCPTFPAVLGDWLAAGFNCFGGAWTVAAGPSAVELTVLDWFRGWLGMPHGTGGLLTSGGSAATVTALVAARHAAVQEEPARLERAVIYTSSQAHSSVVRAAWIAGVPRANVRSIEVDAGFRMDTDALVAAIAEDRRRGLLPFAVVASAGTTNTGSVDPLSRIADICAAESIWYHIDAAYGGFAILTDRGRALLAGIERADTVTLDPHKWLFVPFECGCLLARDPTRLRDAFRILPEYLRDVETNGEEVNFADYGEQLTRSTRALKVWLPVQFFGVGALRSAIDTGINLAKHAETLMRADPFFEILSPAQLGITCFRIHPDGIDDDAKLDVLNQRINEKVNALGQHFISSTRLNGRFSLRICVLGFRTTERDIDELVESLRSAVL
ncbi:MAG: aminotransferase class V-fold PLP-dependent enzyme [Gemmatimonadota bacterium]